MRNRFKNQGAKIEVGFHVSAALDSFKRF